MRNFQDSFESLKRSSISVFFNLHDCTFKYEGPVFKRKEVCDEELKNAFLLLKSNKSPEYDFISSNVIKSVLEEIFSILKHVLNLSINQGVFPENMKIACVTPIFKSVDE